MSQIVLLDSGPLGLVTNPRASPEVERCNQWIRSLLLDGIEIAIPEIADYEVRRELLRGNKSSGIKRLDALKTTLAYLPLTTETMLLAAKLWARARQQGTPMAGDKALDGDVILAAQATLAAHGGDSVVVATTNVGHLSRFVIAQEWHDITSELL